MNVPADSPVNRGSFWGLATAYVLLLTFLVPPFLRTPLDCDPMLFDLYARDAGQGALLYRDMVENNTPAMVGIHVVVRSVFGWSHEAMRAVDLLVVGMGIFGLVRWIPTSRFFLRGIVLFALTAFYLTASEWCHAQRDVWLLAPVMAAMHVRRAHRYGAIGPRLLEGVLWGLAICLKPHVAIVVAAVWFVSAWRARACTGATVGDIFTDACAVLFGILAVISSGYFAMNLLEIWQPYVLHLTGWAGDYANANFYGPHGPWPFRIQFAIRQFPWSPIYFLSLLVATLCFIRMARGQRRCDDCLLAAAFVGWSFQAFAFQHVFDYPHVPSMMLAIVFLARRLDASGWIRPAALTFVVAFFVVKGTYLYERATLWPGCFNADVTPAFRDRLLQNGFVNWNDLTPVAEYIRNHNYKDGDLNVLSDSALPLWQMTGLRPPTRYYLFRNNLQAFPSKRATILDAVNSLPHQRAIVCDLTKIRWSPTLTTPPHDLPDDWYGPNRWADRVAFRSGRYVVVAMTASEVRMWMTDVTDMEQ